jgi:hypothetical protein
MHISEKTDKIRLKINGYTSGWVGLLFALIVAGAFVSVTFSADFLLGTGSYWRTQVSDVTQYIAGFNMYFTAPWQFPLLAFDALNYPVGTMVTFVDAIPLYALILKTFLPASLAPFNPFGVWVGLCFLLQGVGAWWIARELETQSWMFLSAMLLILLTFPALMARIGHISLMSHWILLFAMALYIRSCRKSRLPHWSWSVLLVGAFYINIYLFVMACGIMLAALFGLQRKPAFRDIGGFFLPFAVLSVTALFMFLPLPKAEITREWGFGYYSMNLLSPLSGGKFLIVQAKEAPGQYEGFNYLGLGIIAALPLAWGIKNRLAPHVFRRHRALLLLMLVYATYALSNQVFFGSEQIVVLRYPGFLDPLTSQFRASGRFFWPVGYCIMVFVLLMLYRGLGKRTFALSIALLVVVQMADLEDRYTIMRKTAQKSGDKPLDTSIWDGALNDRVRNIYFYPKFKCGENPHETLLPIMRYASERGLRLNTGYIARYTPDCNDAVREISSSEPSTSAYVFVRSEYPDLSDVKALFPQSMNME